MTEAPALVSYIHARCAAGLEARLFPLADPALGDVAARDPQTGAVENWTLDLDFCRDWTQRAPRPHLDLPDLWPVVLRCRSILRHAADLWPDRLPAPGPSALWTAEEACLLRTLPLAELVSAAPTDRVVRGFSGRLNTAFHQWWQSGQGSILRVLSPEDPEDSRARAWLACEVMNTCGQLDALPCVPA